MAYPTYLEAATYFETRMYTRAWDTADLATRNKALEHATRLIDRLAYNGAKTDDNQTNEFPRDGDTVVPTAIKEACCEVALSLLDGVDPEKQAEEVSIQSQGFSSVRSTFNRDFVQAYKASGLLSAAAYALLKPYLRDWTTVKIERVS